MDTELDLTCDEVHFSDWLTSREVPDYEKIGGLILFLLSFLW